MEENEQNKKISWDEAVVSNFISFEDGETKTVKIIDWSLYQTEKFGDQRTAFNARVLEENGKKIENEKYVWDTTSQPAMRALKPILENKDIKNPIVLKVTRLGDRSDTKYKIDEVE